MPNACHPRRLPWLRRFLALATDNWPARGYLAVFAAFVPVAFLFPDSVYATIPILLTEPLSLLGVVIPIGPGIEDSGGPAVVLAAAITGVRLLLCALVNAAALGALAHHVRDLRTARHA
ncbi:SCO4225 family membrane protein [Streptomyces sp. KR55]|uniref:SCO4225 family membrane protein n=1 Tax=Streptomyces sp. KR55 TaxID=3457425 RepID=UPI003FCFE199